MYSSTTSEYFYHPGSCEQQDQDLTLKVGPVSQVRPVANHHAGRVNHHLPAAPQVGLDLPGPPALFQPQGEQVVMTAEADQDPLANVDPVTREPQGAGTVTEIGSDRKVSLGELKDRGRRQNVTSADGHM